MVKLTNLNGHYLREAEDDRLVELIWPQLQEMISPQALSATARDLLVRAMPGLKVRAKTLLELASSAAFYVRPRPLPIDEKAARLLDPEARQLLGELTRWLEEIDPWTEAEAEACVRRFAEDQGKKLGKVAQPLRAALTGSTTSPGIFEVMALLGKEEALARLRDATA